MSGYEAERYNRPRFGRASHQPSRGYVRFVALGDSASCGVGDPTPAGWRGWARILADAIGTDHPVSFCKLAVPDATVADVRRYQLSEALNQRPAIDSLVVGLNDVLGSTWDLKQIREDLLHCAEALSRQGALTSWSGSTTTPACSACRSCWLARHVVGSGPQRDLRRYPREVRHPAARPGGRHRHLRPRALGRRPPPPLQARPSPTRPDRRSVAQRGGPGLRTPLH
jgi:GDSL-like Lipase/Acylhydrolase family